MFKVTELISFSEEQGFKVNISKKMNKVLWLLSFVCHLMLIHIHMKKTGQDFMIDKFQGK